MNELLLIPGTAALIGGIIGYTYQQVQKWRAVSALLEAEINNLLRNAQEDLDFLDRPSHYWLKVGVILQTAPKAFSSKYRVFDSLVKDLYILGRDKATKVLAFYEHHAFCENLRQSLFENVAGLKDVGHELKESDVAVLRARLQRCCAAYRILTGKYPQTITLRNLQNSYEISDAQNVLKALSSTTKPSLPKGDSDVCEL